MSDIAIRVEKLSKKYRIGRAQQRHDTLREALSGSVRGLGGRLRRNGHERVDEIWALKDVSFEVQRGEVVGVIGRNGAGKSTLLKILSQITEPTSGRAEIHGRVGSLLEVGTGFHPELTGRENIYLSGAMLGMRREEIGRKFDEIVDFSGVEKFIDTPIKRYSSGMNVRLGFAVAAHLEPEIVLVDEVLAVGDAEFQRKCLGKMGDVAREGRTVLFVSHNMAAVVNLCPKSVLMQDGELVDFGSTRAIVDDYLSEVFHQDTVELDRLRAPGLGSKIWFSSILLQRSGSARVRYSEPLTYEMQISSRIAASDLSIGYSFFNEEGLVVGTGITRGQFSIGANEKITLGLTLSDLRLAPRLYFAGFSIGYGGIETERQDFDMVAGTLLSFQVLPPIDGENSFVGWGRGWGSIVLDKSELWVLGNRERFSAEEAVL